MNRGRARFRLRIAAETKLDDNWTLGFRLASGSDPDPTSTNQSMDDNFAKKDMWIDRVYAIYKAGNVKIAAGKIANPFETTDIIWDSDINLEGVAETFSFENGHITLGQMVLSENSSAADAYLLPPRADSLSPACPSTSVTIPTAIMWKTARMPVAICLKTAPRIP